MKSRLAGSLFRANHKGMEANFLQCKALVTVFIPSFQSAIHQVLKRLEVGETGKGYDQMGSRDPPVSGEGCLGLPPSEAQPASCELADGCGPRQEPPSETSTASPLPPVPIASVQRLAQRWTLRADRAAASEENLLFATACPGSRTLLVPPPAHTCPSSLLIAGGQSAGGGAGTG